MNKMIKEQEQGNLIVLSGPSGAGKDSIINELKNYYHNFWLSISMTSRKPRDCDDCCCDDKCGCKHEEHEEK